MKKAGGFKPPAFFFADAAFAQPTLRMTASMEYSPSL